MTRIPISVFILAISGLANAGHGTVVGAASMLAPSAYEFELSVVTEENQIQKEHLRVLEQANKVSVAYFGAPYEFSIESDDRIVRFADETEMTFEDLEVEAQLLD
jgi:hypothetical protein